MSEELELRTFLRQSSQTTTTVTFPLQAEDLDGYSSQGNSAMSLTEELGLSTANIPVRTMDEDLLPLLEERDEDKFIEVAGERGLHEDKDATSKFLQLACEMHLVKIVEYLLKPDVDPNWVTDETSKTPLRIAVEKGFFKVVELLLEHKNIKVEKDLLNELIMRINYKTNKVQNHKECYKLCVGRFDVNYKDKWGNYPMHYATRYGGPEVVLDLLQRKASLSNRNKNNVLTISDCDYNTLREHFDRCVEMQPGNKLNKKDVTISFDYRTLLPSPEEAPDDKKPSQETAPDDEEKESCLVNSDTNCLMPEADAVLYMSKSSELKPLLEHPLITTFLYFKRNRYWWIDRVNLFFFAVFYLSLIYYIATNFSERSEKSIFSLILLMVTSLLLLVREILQLLVLGTEYMTNVENYIEVTLIVIVFIVLFCPFDRNTSRQLFSVIMLLHSFEHLFLTGTFHSVMLRIMSRKFFWCMLFYFPLIISFANSFTLLFHVVERQPSNCTAVQEEEKHEFFVIIFKSLFKTIVMLAGDFEVGEINFDQYPVTSRLIFIAFVITMVLILLNLVNSLAVSDIRKEAELVSHIARAQYVAHAESMYVYLKKLHVPKTFLSYLPIYPTDYTLFVYPNQKCRVRAEKKPIWGYDYLDEKTVSIAMKLVQTKRLEEDKVLREREESERIQKERDQKLDEVLELLRIQGRSRVD